MSHKNTLTQKGIVAMTALLFFGSGLTLAGQYALEDYNTVIRVNNTRITRSDVARRTLEYQPYFQQIKTPKEQQADYVHDALIERELLVQAAQKENMTVSAEDVEAEWQKVFNQQYSGDQEAFERDLARSNYTPSLYRRELKSRLLANKMRERIQQDVKVTEPELKAHYEENKANYAAPERVSAQHILIHTDEGEDKARQKATRILAQIQQGKPFEALAKAESDDGTSSEEGGQLPLFSRGDMSADFEKAVWPMKPGDISQAPVKTEFGFHIIKRGKTLAAGPKPFAEARPVFEPRLQAEAETKALEKWLEKAKKAANITRKSA